jgi:hypothetical protein
MTLLQQIHELVDCSSRKITMADEITYASLELMAQTISCSNESESAFLIKVLESFMQHWGKNGALSETYREDKKQQFTRIYNACGFS